MSEGVEWALHCCVDLSRVGSPQAVPAARLAALYDLPPAYLNKQLQALGRAGIVTSTAGPRGGFRLARPAEEITVLDVVMAIEGTTPAFRCTDITHRGHAGVLTGRSARPDVDRRVPCAIAQAMRFAELAWRRHLAARTVADVRMVAEERSPAGTKLMLSWMTTPGPEPTGATRARKTPTRKGKS